MFTRTDRDLIAWLERERVKLKERLEETDDPLVRAHLKKEIGAIASRLLSIPPVK